MPFPNRYPGNCTRCGVRVLANDGMTDKVGGAWLVYCADHAPNVVKREAAPVVADRFAALPAGVVPFPHQHDGVEWMQRRGRKGGILADDMGLGKTMQTLTSIPVDADGVRYPVVIICPAVAKTVWKREAARFAPDLKVEALAGRGSFRWPAKGEAVVTNFDILPDTVEGAGGFPALPEALLSTLPANLVVVVDEAHKVKSWSSKRTKAVRAIAFAARKSSGRVFLLTGTPLTNDPRETYSLLVAAGLQFETFRGEFDRAMNLAGGRKGRYGWEFNGQVQSGFADALKPVMLRRRKDEVLSLPPKRYETHTVEIDRCKEADAFVDLLRMKGVDLGNAATTLESIGKVGFEQMSRAREALARAKTPTAIDLAKSWVEDGEQIIVFSAHLAPVQACATLEGFATITGDTPNDERADIEARFQRGEIRGIAATIKAAGVALTLTAATRVLFVDKAWTPADNEQAEDRAYRIGQTKSVLITTLEADHALDGRINVLLAHKQDLIDGAIEAARVKQGERVVLPPVAPAPAPAPVAPVVVTLPDFSDLPFALRE
jgi:SNF2 family DNA or RNA helicase